MVYYQDNEIIIRDICNEDVISLFSWNIDREINRHDPKPLPHLSAELLKECTDYSKRFDNEIMNENVDDRKYKYFIITDKENQPIGFVNFFSVDRIKKQGEMGVVIGDKRYWRKGIAYRGVDTAIDYIFNNLDIDRIYIETGETNISALKLFEKLGFNKCGEYLEDNDFKFIVMEKIKIS
jgi:RimJ/RimL family protein N-acetyltransferase